MNEARPRPEIIVLAGTNGAGKSSVGGEALRESGGDYYNPDEAARDRLRAFPGVSVQEADSRAWTRSCALDLDFNAIIFRTGSWSSPPVACSLLHTIRYAIGEETPLLPGTCALFLRRHAIELHDLTTDEAAAYMRDNQRSTRLPDAPSSRERLTTSSRTIRDL